MNCFYFFLWHVWCWRLAWLVSNGWILNVYLCCVCLVSPFHWESFLYLVLFILLVGMDLFVFCFVSFGLDEGTYFPFCPRTEVEGANS